MNWLMILVLVNIHTGDVTTYTEQPYASANECDVAGTSHISNTQYPDGLKANYICLSGDLFKPAPNDPKKDKKVLGIFG